MTEEKILSILYDLSLAGSGETRVEPLILKMLKRLLYHTSFPCGVFFSHIKVLNIDESKKDNRMCLGYLEAVIGNRELARKKASSITLPSELLKSDSALVTDQKLIEPLCGEQSKYKYVLRFHTSDSGVFLLLSPNEPENVEFLSPNLFEPGLDIFAKNLYLCRVNEAHTKQIIEDKNQAVYKLKRFRAALDVSRDGFYLIDPWVMKFIDVNEMALKELGYSAEEMRFMGPHDIKPEYAREVLKAYFMQVIEDDQYGKIVTTHKRKDGSEFPVDVRINALHQENGKSLIIANSRDITEELKAENALRESEERYRQLVELSPDAVIILQDEKIVFINSMFTKLLGYDMKDIHEGLGMYDMVVEEDRDKSKSRYLSRLDGKGLSSLHRLRLNTKSQAVIACETSSSLIVYQHKPAALVLLRDISERIRTEEELELYIHKLEEASAELEETNATLEEKYTELKISDDALYSSQSTLQTLLNSIDSIIYVADMDTYEVIFVNEFGRKMLGEITGRICWQTIQRK
ncbi:MAG: PAS domain S-box protein, partial [Spirochaetota bacterium]|nr:PAS domain S-box protein [Spirochaetota bacterium]